MNPSQDVNPEAPVKDCGCLRCAEGLEATIMIMGVSFPMAATRMFVCDTCGNKRCPHSDDHRNPCSGSNSPGQPGSRYA
jgi:hypothetical protein